MKESFAESAPPYRPRTRGHARGLVAFLVAGLLSALPAQSAPNDIDLIGLVDPVTGVPRDDDFRKLTQELSVVMTPTSLQPAETTGQAGFDFAIDYGIHDINEQEAYWKDAVEGRLTNRSLFPVHQTLGIRGRKGFVLPVPLTSELELGANWLVDSGLATLGGNVRVALNEGFQWLPDIAVMAGIQNLLGGDELQMVTLTAGGSVSKGFAIAGSANLCPFLSYQSLFTHASTKVFDPDPSDTTDIGNNKVFQEIPFYDLSNRIDRVSVGARLNVAIVQLTVGADFNLIPDGNDRRLLMQYSGRFGLLF